MRYLKIGICDDDPAIADQLNIMIENYFINKNEYQVELYISYSIDGIIDEPLLDIAFIDIFFDETPQGIEAIKHICDKKSGTFIVIMSSIESFHISKQGFYYNAVDYFVKPINESELYRVLTNVLEQISIKKPSKTITLKDKKQTYIIECDDILYLDIVGRQKRIITKDAIYTTNKSLKELFEQLPQNQFSYTHSAYIVNLDKVSSFTAQSIELINNVEIPLTRSYKTVFQEKMNKLVQRQERCE